MDDNTTNRMAAARRRGPPIGMKTPPPDDPQAVVDIPQPPRSGVRCQGCGVVMIPRRDRVEGAAKCYATCSRCPQRMALSFQDGRIVSVRWIDR